MTKITYDFTKEKLCMCRFHGEEDVFGFWIFQLGLWCVVSVWSLELPHSDSEFTFQLFFS